MQSRGVMVAQVVLVHLAEVRILAGLPIFLNQMPVKVDWHFFMRS